MRFMRSLTTAAVGTAVVLGGMASSASAGVGTGSLSQNSRPASGAPISITVTYSGWSPNTVVDISLCSNTDANPPFDPFTQCSPYKATLGNTNASGAGSKTFELWAGSDPNGNPWSCGTDTDGIGAVQSTCWVRIADTGPSSADDLFLPVTYTAAPPPTTTTTPPTTVVPPAQVPEAPLGVLLPLTAAALVGGGIVIARRRSSSAA